jgi:hypothetical protein
VPARTSRLLLAVADAAVAWSAVLERGDGSGFATAAADGAASMAGTGDDAALISL